MKNNSNNGSSVRWWVVASLAAAVGLNAAWHKPKSVQAVVSDATNRILPIQGRPGQTNGTGVLVKLPSGITGLITNEHVCTGVYNAFGQASTVYFGEVLQDLIKVRVSSEKDLCLFISPTLLHDRGYRIATPDEYATGQKLILIGFPLGGPLAPQTGYYITQREVDIATPVQSLQECKSGNVFPTPSAIYCLVPELLNQMTTLTYPGNSGSPVFNEEGELVGIANSGASDTAQGNFISGSVVREFLRGL